jgi:hydrogenase expression/formation protein HypC
MRGRVSLHGNEVPVSLVLVPEVRVGDWVLVHAGFAIQRIEAEEAAETFRILGDMEKANVAAGGDVREVGRGR